MSELSLTLDARAVAVRELRKMLSAGSELLSQIGEQSSPEMDHVQNLLGLCEYHFADAAKAIGVSSQSANTVAMRKAMLLEAHARIRELESLAENASSAAQVKEGVRGLSEKLNYWWRTEGLGFAHDIYFAEHRCTVKLNCSLSGDFLLIDSDTPVSDKELRANWLATLRGAGFVISPDGRSSRDEDVIDCDQSRESLIALIKKRLPSARVWSFECRARRDGQMKLSSIELHLRNYDEIDALPTPVKD